MTLANTAGAPLAELRLAEQYERIGKLRGALKERPCLGEPVRELL